MAEKIIRPKKQQKEQMTVKIDLRVEPVYKNGKLHYFKSNAIAGDHLMYVRSTGHEANILPKEVIFLGETETHMLVSWGSYKRSVNKASVFCGDDVLYILNVPVVEEGTKREEAEKAQTEE